MKAAVLPGLGRKLVIEDLPDPEPGAGDLVLRVRSCGICGSDLHASALPPGLPPGTVMGHEFAGEVVAVGSRAKGEWRPGDRVCALPFIGCGACAACLAGDGIRCAAIQATGLGGLPGAYAEYVRVGAHESLRMPASVGFTEGALVEPLAVGLHAVHEARLAPGANVLVIGAGPIGLVTTLWARFLGARAVVVSEKAAGRRDLAEKLGATAVLDPASANVASEFQRLAGAPPDVIFECVGVPGLLQQCIQLAAPRGRVVVVGVCMQPDTILPVMAVVKEVSVHFVLGYRKRDFQTTLDLLDAERIDCAAMVTDVVGLGALPDAFEALKQPTTQCKVMVEP